MPIDFMENKDMLEYVGQQLNELLHLYKKIADRESFSVSEINSLQQNINTMLKGLKDNYGATFKMSDDSEEFDKLTIMSQICTLSKAYLKAGIIFLDKNTFLNKNEFNSLRQVYEPAIANFVKTLDLFEQIDNGESLNFAKTLQGRMQSLITSAPPHFFTPEPKKTSGGIASQVQSAAEDADKEKKEQDSTATNRKGLRN